MRPFVPSDEANYVSYWHDGIADLEFLDRIVADVFEESGADGLTIEVRTRNSAMNAVLQKLGHPIVATRDLAAPDGLAGSGTFNFYEIDRGATQRI